MSKQALIFLGGWEGHSPEIIAQRFSGALQRADFEVILSDSLECLNEADALASFDLIVPCWTMGTLTAEQERALCTAVRRGSGLAGAHGGMGDAFRGALDYNYMVGGHFVGHPYVGPYAVTVTQPDHPLTRMLPERFVYDSEQYYLQVDPNLNVLMATEYDVGDGTVAMPVAWTRRWGLGRVFYCALGHTPEEYDVHPAVWDFIVAGCLWAAR